MSQTLFIIIEKRKTVGPLIQEYPDLMLKNTFSD